MFDNTESGLMTDEGLRPSDFETMDNADEFNQVYESAPATEETPSTTKWALRDRLRSKVVWMGVAAEIISILAVVGLLKKFDITPTAVETIVFGIIKILELFGIFNDPTSRGRF